MGAILACAISRRRGAIAVGLMIVSLIASSLTSPLSGVATASGDASMTLSTQWSNNVSTGKVSYTLDLRAYNYGEPGRRCYYSCYYGTQTAYQATAGGAITPVANIGPYGPLAARANVIEQSMTGTDIVMKPVTHIRAFLYNPQTYPQYDYGDWIVVSAPFPPARTALVVNNWHRDPDTGLVTHDLGVRGAGAGQPGAHCYSSTCYYGIDAGFRPAGSSTVNYVTNVMSRAASSGTWSFYDTQQVTNGSYPAITHLRSYLHNPGMYPSFVYGDWIPVSDSVIGDFDLNEYALLLAVVPRETFCTPLLLDPARPPNSSIPYSYTACDAVNSGKTYINVLRQLVNAYQMGTALLDLMVVEHQKFERIPPTPPPSAPNVSLAAKAGVANPSPYPESLYALVVAPECRRRVVAAGIFRGSKGGHPCDDDPIYAPGTDAGQATQHRFDAITSVPLWVELHYENGTLKEQTQQRDWYNSDPICSSKPDGTQCDEYPNWASEEGGGLVIPRPSLRAIPAADNKAEGDNYGAFLRKCRIAEGQSFFVIPQVGPAAGVTLRKCAAS